MYRFYSALIVLLLVALTAGFGSCMITGTATEITEQLETAKDGIEKNNLTSANAALRTAESLLQQNKNILYIFSCHEIIDNIERHIEKTMVCLDTNEINLSLLYCKTAVNLTKDYAGLEYPYLYNII